jgi:hypothetical protein
MLVAAAVIAVLVLLALAGRAAKRSLRTFVRSLWPH